MNFRRTIVVISASAAIVSLAPIGASAGTTVGYITNTPACTTKDAQRPNNSQRRNAAGNDWWMGTPQSQMTTRMPAGQNPNDFPAAFQTFPTVYSQPTDKDGAPTVANGQKTFPVSTCGNPA
jgi:hypothetical protein